MGLMYLAADYVHPYEVDARLRSRCRIRLYLPSEDKDAAVVICSELSNNPGTSVTKAAEVIAAEIIEHFKLPEPPVWIEHYPKGATDGETETFDLVVLPTTRWLKPCAVGRLGKRSDVQLGSGSTAPPSKLS